MPDPLSVRNPPAPTCEDYDDDNDTVFLPDVADRRQDPHLATKGSYERQRTGGSDSGYSSKAGTNDSENSVRRKLADLTINTDLTERKRQPYSMSYSQPRPKAYAEPSGHTKDKEKSAKVEAKPYYVHKKGECWVCDKYGQHVDLPDEVTKRRPPSSPKTTRQPPPSATKDDDAVRPAARRQSTTGSARPASMYAPSTSQIRYSAQPLGNSIPYTTTSIPISYAMPITTTLPYTTSSYPYTPVTPMSAYSQDAANPYFEEVRYRDEGYPITSRRSSIYGTPVLHSPIEEVVSRPLQRTSSQREPRSSVTSHRPARDLDYERGERDRAAMPPPRKPQPIEVVTAPHRPGIRKSATYNTQSSPSTATTASNRHSAVYEDDLDYDSMKQLAPVREYEADRPVEKSRPPSSYPSERTRPRASKSASYSTPTHTTRVSSSSNKSDRDPPQRVSRATTLPTSTPLTYENRVSEAEAHQRVRSTLTSSELTTEALRKYTQREPASSHSRSETESSHKSHSSSSVGHSKKTTRSNSGITMSVGGVNLSMNPSDGQNINISTSSTGGVSISLAKANRGSRDLSEVGAQQKRIERAPSVASRSSRVSTASRRDRDKDRDRDREREILMLRESNTRPNISRTHSRAPSRRDSDFGRDERETWSEQ